MTVLDEGQKGKGTETDAPDAPALETHRDGGTRARTREEEVLGHSPGALTGDSVPDTESDPDELATLLDLWMDRGKETVAKIATWFGKDTGFGREHPPSLIELFGYWKSAPMAGSFAPLKLAQRLDGFTFGLAFTLIGYAFAWLGQRPLRRGYFILAALIVWRFL